LISHALASVLFGAAITVYGCAVLVPCCIGCRKYLICSNGKKDIIKKLK
jgi:hypothetical protein